MRLDHLLSKEHLTPPGVQNPGRRHTFFAGSSWVEHLTWHRDLISELVRRFGGWKVLGEGTGVCTLLGPEGPDAHWPSGRVHSRLLWAFRCFPGGEAVRGTARTLRTTQWTRASCNSLRVVAQDDLKDH